MASVGTSVTQALVGLLQGGELQKAVARVSERAGTILPAVTSEQIVAQYVSTEMIEKSLGVRYPAFYVYCEGLANLLREKFRSFSGKVYMAIEVRVSHDRLEAMPGMLHSYVEAVTEVLEKNRGEWIKGVSYAGGYKVEFGPVRHGGKNFLQTAKIRFELDASQG